MEFFEPTEGEVIGMLENECVDKNNTQEGPLKQLNTNTVHAIPNESYVVIQPTPEHLFDTTAIFGSQFRNLIYSDLPVEIEITIGKHKIKGRENVIRAYQAAIIENLLESWDEISERFSSIE
jgi:hypothetical protein